MELSKTFQNRLKIIYTKEELGIINKWFSTDTRKTTFRINTLKWNVDSIESELKTAWLFYSKIDYLNNSYVLYKWREKDLWDTEIFKTWKIYIQWLSSQIPVNIMDINNWNTILDVTASPWSKTSQIAEKIKNTWKIYACDNNQIRIDKLNFTLKRQWVTNVEVIKTDARNLWEKLNEVEFDNILFDAPCSAEWRFNLNKEKSYSFWSEENIKSKYKLQKQILQSIIPLLKSWWELVYSTCTLAPEENENIVHFILCNYPDLKIQDINTSFPNTKHWILEFWKQRYKKEVSKSLRILPSPESEWFFVARFIKNQEL